MERKIEFSPINAVKNRIKTEEKRVSFLAFKKILATVKHGGRV